MLRRRKPPPTEAEDNIATEAELMAFFYPSAAGFLTLVACYLCLDRMISKPAPEEKLAAELRKAIPAAAGCVVAGLVAAWRNRAYAAPNVPVTGARDTKKPKAE